MIAAVCINHSSIFPTGKKYRIKFYTGETYKLHFAIFSNEVIIIMKTAEDLQISMDPELGVGVM
jgi:hypothetical protein